MHEYGVSDRDSQKLFTDMIMLLSITEVYNMSHGVGIYIAENHTYTPRDIWVTMGILEYCNYIHYVHGTINSSLVKVY